MAAVLTSGERVVRCLTGGDIDRVPFGVGLGWHPWGAALPNWRRATSCADLEPATYFGYDEGFALPKLAYGIFPGFEEIVIEKKFCVYRLAERTRHYNETAA